MNYPVAQRGSVPLQHGDLTAQRAQLARAEADAVAGYVENSIRELQDPDIPRRVVPVEGRTTPAVVPQFVYDAILRSASKGGRR